MAAALDVKKDHAPYANPIAGTNLDTITANNPVVEKTITFKLVGTVAQIQADWATLKGATITATSSSLDWS